MHGYERRGSCQGQWSPMPGRTPPTASGCWPTSTLANDAGAAATIDSVSDDTAQSFRHDRAGAVSSVSTTNFC